MTVKAQKFLAGLLGLALFVSVLLVGYVDLKRRAKSSNSERPVTGVLSPQIERGLKIYEKFSCITCHGVAGKGGIKNYNAQTGGEVPPLDRVAEGFSKEELIKKILEGIPKVEKLDPKGPTTPLYMPGYKNIISQTELEALVAYLNWLMPKNEKDTW